MSCLSQHSSDPMTPCAKRVVIKYGGESKTFRFSFGIGLVDQLRSSFRLGSLVPIELVDITNAIVPLSDIVDGETYTARRVDGGEDWSCRPLFQTKDPIHGIIALPDVCARFIDTPQFQRLRDLKQVGSCHLVYMAGVHTRFEHSLGVASLAFRMATSICQRQPELGITSRDVLCVTLGALCHDLGHGPGSHMWDSSILGRLGVDMPHEQMSQLIVDDIISTTRQRWIAEQKTEDPFDGLTDDDVSFIKAVIHPPTTSPLISPTSRFIETSPRQGFLLDIVSNKASGLDVDKFDYLMRDTHNTGVRGVFDIDRLIHNAVVRECNGSLQICFPQKQLDDIAEIFHTRDSLHRRVYQHRTNLSIESMFRDAILSAAPCIEIRNSNGDWLNFKDSQLDVSTFTKVSDWIFKLLLYGQDIRVDWDDYRVIRARELLTDIQYRRIWKFVGTMFGEVENFQQVKQELEKCSGGYISADLWELKTAMFSWGKGDANPLENVPFTQKNCTEPMKPKATDLSRVFIPATFREHVLYVFIKSQDPDLRELAKTSFEQWCTERGIESSLVDMSSVTLSKKSRRRSATTANTPRNKRVARMSPKNTTPKLRK